MKYSVGTTYEGKDLNFLKDIAPFVRHIEVSPDSIATYNEGRTMINPSSMDHLKWLCQNTDIDILVHGVGLSIGSFDGCSKAYFGLLDELFLHLPIKWH